MIINNVIDYFNDNLDNLSRRISSYENHGTIRIRTKYVKKKKKENKKGKQVLLTYEAYITS